MQSGHDSSDLAGSVRRDVNGRDNQGQDHAGDRYAIAPSAASARLCWAREAVRPEGIKRAAKRHGVGSQPLGCHVVGPLLHGASEPCGDCAGAGYHAPQHEVGIEDGEMSVVPKTDVGGFMAGDGVRLGCAQCVNQSSTEHDLWLRARHCESESFLPISDNHVAPMQCARRLAVRP